MILLLALTTFSIVTYLIYFKQLQVKHALIFITVIGFVIQLLSSTQYLKKYIIFLIIIYLGSVFIKLGARFVWNIFKSIDHRRKFTTCFTYIFLYSTSIFLIVSTTDWIGLNWAYFLIFFILDYYYFNFLNWAHRAGVENNNMDEWEESITFAIIAATIIHIFFIQPFTIPTSSMEKSMLVGDFLLVSKMHYGANIPNTPIALPFMHQKIPGTDNTPSYSKLIQLGYNRLPGFQKIKNNDIVVFNFPVDTLHNDMPFDKKMNYVKRCVEIAGDTLEIIDKNIMINNQKTLNVKRIQTQFNYIIKPKEKQLSLKYKEKLAEILIDSDIEAYTEYEFKNRGRLEIKFIKNGKKEQNKYKDQGWKLRYTGSFMVFITKKEKEILEKKYNKWFMFTEELRDKNLFPKSLSNNWNVDNYGPIYIPKKHDTLLIDSNTIHFYKKIIEDYENNQLDIQADHIAINNIKTDKYIVKMNYYWMMGDNRHNSEDSRVWGFVPENHIVGKPIFTWLSLNYNALNKKGIMSKINIIRWEKLFTTIHGPGTSKSYFIYFVLFIFLINFGPKLFRKINR